MGTSARDLRAKLRDAFAWRGSFADPSGWWCEPALLSALGPALAVLHDERPTLVVGIESKGFILGPLTATALGVGFVAIEKGLTERAAGEQVLRRSTPPDYNDRSIDLYVRRRLLGPGQRVLLVDEWIVTGGQATAARRLVEDAGAAWIGVASIVDATPHAIRRALGVRSLLRLEEL